MPLLRAAASSIAARPSMHSTDGTPGTREAPLHAHRVTRVDVATIVHSYYVVVAGDLPIFVLFSVLHDECDCVTVRVREREKQYFQIGPCFMFVGIGTTIR